MPNFSKAYAESATELNETTETIKVTSNGETAYYEDFSTAVGNLAKNSTITLLKDATLYFSPY